MPKTSVEIPSESSVSSVLPGSPDLRRLVSPSKGAWLEYRKTLRPNYFVAWCELLFCILLMIAGYVGHLWLARNSPVPTSAAWGLLFALWIGFWMQALLTFGHESAHYNLAASKKLNDFLSDWTIWLFFPQSAKSYRSSHWQHHLHLGDHQDTEISYHHCLSPWFLAKAITGVYLLEIVARYFLRSRPTTARTQGSSSAGFLPVARFAVIQLVFLGVAVACSSYITAAVWLVAAALFFPFFASVRQILEHRAIAAPCEVDFTRELHGPVNRMFGRDAFSHCFGAAGFNRHLLHHWDPTVSYTRFNDMQNFLRETELAPQLDAAQSSYFVTLGALLRTALRAGEP